MFLRQPTTLCAAALVPICWAAAPSLRAGSLDPVASAVAVRKGAFRTAIVVTQRPRGRSGIDGDIGFRLVLVKPGAHPFVLTSAFASAADPSVSFDGTKVLFAGKQKPDDLWAIYEMNADGSGPRRVIGGAEDHRQPIYLPSIYTLAPNPNQGTDRVDQIGFVSVTPGRGDGADRAVRANLYSCRPDGSGVQRLTYNPIAALDPAVLPDGRIVYASRREALPERDDGPSTSLLAINADGTDPAIYSSDEGQSEKRMPCVTANGLVVFVEQTANGGPEGGTLASVSLRRNLHSYRRITDMQAGRFRSPSPLPNGQVLVAHRSPNGGSFGIVRIDPTNGRYAPVFDDPDHDDVQACALVPRTPPDQRSSVVNLKNPVGKLYGLDLSLNDIASGLLPRGAIKRLRILASVADDGCRTNVSGAQAERSHALGRPLGEVPVEADGSFQAIVPSDTAIRLQTLDADGLALRTSGWIWVRGGAAQGCVGCHEDGELAPANRFPKALALPPANLSVSSAERRGIEFWRDIAPIAAARCLACHQNERPEQRFGAPHVRSGVARTSPLVWHLFGRNTARPWDAAAGFDPRRAIPAAAGLTEDERRRIVEWIDTGAARYAKAPAR